MSGAPCSVPVGEAAGVLRDGISSAELDDAASALVGVIPLAFETRRKSLPALRRSSRPACRLTTRPG